ncbi:hypothetical protein AB2L57_10805 [Microbacterium sp. HA-8]|uniref:hypothetical protein n=1 Tax=Microbacterium sp. HA-8 TaxID=3234200 RepID=UPI0038F69FF1
MPRKATRPDPLATLVADPVQRASMHALNAGARAAMTLMGQPREGAPLMVACLRAPHLVPAETAAWIRALDPAEFKISGVQLSVVAASVERTMTRAIAEARALAGEQVAA